jgi:glycosyltransferase involved in cell wall biosynthesis
VTGTEPKTILLYNHATGTGHHESWMALFAALLLDRGYRVVCITPDIVALENVLLVQRVDANDRLIKLPVPAILPVPPTLWQQITSHWHRGGRGRGGSIDSKGVDDGRTDHRPRTLFDKWRAHAPMYAKHAPEVRATKDLPAAVQLKRQILQLFVPPVWHTLRALRSLVRRFLTNIHAGERGPANLTAAANLAFRQTRWKPDFMFSMYADIWMTNPRYWRREIDIPVPWGGIRFIPFPKKAAGREGYFRNSNFRGLCFLDEAAVADYGQKHPEKVFEFVPDVANADLPISHLPLASEMRHLACGRKIVLLCGSIEGRKNVKMFCELAQLAPPNEFFLAIVGQVHSSTFTTDEKKLLSSFIEMKSSHTFFKDVYFEDERDMNAVIEAANIIFAIYRDFRISSNMLGKAAAFEKPILVAKDYLMGKRVEKYGIGRAIPPNDVQLAMAALIELNNVTELKENFKVFRDDFSINALQTRFLRFIERCIGK